MAPRSDALLLRLLLRTLLLLKMLLRILLRMLLRMLLVKLVSGDHGEIGTVIQRCRIGQQDVNGAFGMRQLFQIFGFQFDGNRRRRVLVVHFNAVDGRHFTVFRNSGSNTRGNNVIPVLSDQLLLCQPNFSLSRSPLSAVLLLLLLVLLVLRW